MKRRDEGFRDPLLFRTNYDLGRSPPHLKGASDLPFHVSGRFVTVDPNQTVLMSFHFARYLAPAICHVRFGSSGLHTWRVLARWFLER
ncbi:hypothetical protein PanWU01x14_309180 [Parasponia andersonii]|uniref:Uncharacterized protein n=1 Tax=Parasponia andersonii TaxID=3476 RepID=A0A2P5AQS3_PARAD|nr:hypothetical protein PanWU01x14_309180 [Parasponia andersonii]